MMRFIVLFTISLLVPAGAAEIGLVCKGVIRGSNFNGMRSVTLSPDNKYVYSAAYDGDIVAVFSRDSATGEITHTGTLKDGIDGVNGLNGARFVIVSPDGRHVYAAGANESAVALFDRDSSTGDLTYVSTINDGINGVDGLRSAWSIAISADGKHVYVVGYLDNGLATFSRNASTGALTFINVIKDNVGGVDGLDGPREVFISPDGKHVYAAASTDHAVSVFSRNSTTGQLTYGGVVKNNVGGLSGFWTPSNVFVSPDGKQVYATAYFGDAVYIFDRNAATGQLTYSDAAYDGLDGARYALVSPDRKYVYVAAFSGAISYFGRDTATGQLNHIGLVRDGVDWVDGLNGAWSICISSDGKYIYAAADGDNAVSWFEVDTNAVVVEKSGHQSGVLLSGTPNPFSASTIVAFDLKEAADVCINVYRPDGRLVKTMVNGEKLSGRHCVSWKAENIPSGIYIIKARIGNYKYNQKLILYK